MASASVRLISVDYEVFGRVQGVFFRARTQDTAEKHGLVGTVKNTRSGTVTGTVQGPEDKIAIMKHWLQYKGSSASVIEKCEFKNERTVPKLEYKDFRINDSYWI